MELGDLVSGIAFYFYPLPVFPEPLPLAAHKALFNISFDIRMNGEGDTLFILLGEYIIEIVFNIIHQQYCRVNGSGAIAGGANFAGNNVHFGPYPLAGNLHESELAWRQNSMFRPVVRHFGPQVIE